jgi:hypothetical protein
MKAKSGKSGLKLASHEPFSSQINAEKASEGMSTPSHNAKPHTHARVKGRKFSK